MYTKPAKLFKLLTETFGKTYISTNSQYISLQVTALVGKKKKIMRIIMQKLLSFISPPKALLVKKKITYNFIRSLFFCSNNIKSQFLIPVMNIFSKVNNKLFLVFKKFYPTVLLNGFYYQKKLKVLTKNNLLSPQSIFCL
jgi:hypothetical protein